MASSTTVEVKVDARLREMLRILADALKFYADDESWACTGDLIRGCGHSFCYCGANPVMEDGGDTARNALNRLRLRDEDDQ